MIVHPAEGGTGSRDAQRVRCANQRVIVEDDLEAAIVKSRFHFLMGDVAVVRQATLSLGFLDARVVCQFVLEARGNVHPADVDCNVADVLTHIWISQGREPNEREEVRAIVFVL
ncbi:MULTISPECIES: hypothetical protein [unclassified Bradyrhizobium]